MRHILILLLLSTLLPADTYYTEPQVHQMRPRVENESHLGPIGVTGIFAHIYPGVIVTVKKTEPGSPADGLFKDGDIILMVNGEKLEGKDPFVVLGTALTNAEATDGIMKFTIKSAADKAVRDVSLKIPVLGAYSDTFPLNCEKSKRIIQQAAAYYSGTDRMIGDSLLNGLACLFLLSTGDDALVPRVKQYFNQFLTPEGTVTGLHVNSWHNGYNGVACAEYFLRTGDTSVLPILQYYCDDAKKRQIYGIGWLHWGTVTDHSYELGGGIKHNAGNQILLTLVLGKMCGVDVDDKTLNGALKHWYRFAGHGAIPTADHRPYRTFRSSGRDGASACVMHVASQAKGDVTIYKKAKEYLTMSELNAWPSWCFNWEVYWHSIAGQFMLDYDPNLYHQTTKRLLFRYDLSRQASGAFYGNPLDHPQFDPNDMGIAFALAYTAPLRNLCITGAKRSNFAKDFTLPEQLWGNKADLEFLSAKPNKDFNKYGKADEVHIPYWKLQVYSWYLSPEYCANLDKRMLLKNVRHPHCTLRIAAARALSIGGHVVELEKLLRDPDPRLRRAALDGINDYDAWFANPVVGPNALKPEDFRAPMCKAITSILSNPNESWYVVDGALFALSHAPEKLILDNMKNIGKWHDHEEWWLREASFNALMGLRNNEKEFLKVLPTMIKMMTKENSYNPRHRMMKQLQEVLKQEQSSQIGKLISQGFEYTVVNTKVQPNTEIYERSGESIVHLVELIVHTSVDSPELVVPLAKLLSESEHFKTMDFRRLMAIIKTNNGAHGDGGTIGLYPVLNKLKPESRKELTRLLCGAYLEELQQRLAVMKEQVNPENNIETLPLGYSMVDIEFNIPLLQDVISDLTNLKAQQ